MNVHRLTTTDDLALYDAWVKVHPQGSLWQSLEWKRYQEALGREVRVYVTGEGTILASALVVIDKTTFGWSTWDIPRGPLLVPRSSFLVDAFLTQIVSDATQQRCLGVYLSPPKDLPTTHEQRSTRNEQPSATRMIDLTKSEEEILAQMHPKGRYNIRVAQKHGVRIEHSDDIEAFYGLLQQTAERDGFRILPLKAYKTFLECLPGSFLLIAYLPPPPSPLPPAGEKGDSPSHGIWPPPLTPPPCGGEGNSPSPGRRGRGLGGGGKMGTTPIASLIGIVWGKTGMYYYGASDYAHRALMAPYALQWEAMRLCKGRGCTKYDLLGIAPSCVMVRRAHHDTSHHPWAGVSAFKEKFGGTVVAYPPEQQIILRPVLWKALQWKRKIIG